MGYRSTFVTDDVLIQVPDWFVEKWPTINYGEDEGKPAFPLSSKFERKFYNGVQEELFLDIAQVLREVSEKYPKQVTIALLHEDGMIDRITITGKKITLQGSLRYDPEDSYNPQLGSRDEVYDIDLDNIEVPESTGGD